MCERKPIPDEVRDHFAYCKDTGRITRTTNASRGPRTAGKLVDEGLCARGYRRARLAGNAMAAHRVAWFLYYGEQPPKYIDHINGDRTDNRIENLRKACHHTNLANAKRSTRNTSGVKGVQRQGDKWIGSVGFKGDRHYLGPFIEIADAEAAVRQLREQIHGDFTNHG